MLVRKTLRSKNKKYGSTRFTKKTRRIREQSGRGEEEEQSSSSEGGIAQMFSLPFSLGGDTESKPEPVETKPETVEEEPETVEPESAKEASEPVEEEPETVEEEEPPKTVSDVSKVQKAFEGYYGVESGDVVNKPPEEDYASMHTNMIHENDDGDLVFKKDLPANTDIAVLYTASIGFKNGVHKYPVCEMLSNREYPDSPPNTVVEMKKLPVEVEDRKGVFVKVFSLVLRTTEEVLEGTKLNLAYVPSLVEKQSVAVSEPKSVKSIEVEDENMEDLRMSEPLPSDEDGESIIEDDDLLETISTSPQSVQVESVEPSE
jgi:hypothetical protein